MQKLLFITTVVIALGVFLWLVATVIPTIRLICMPAQRRFTKYLMIVLFSHVVGLATAAGIAWAVSKSFPALTSWYSIMVGIVAAPITDWVFGRIFGVAIKNGLFGHVSVYFPDREEKIGNFGKR
jgi:hypothetical protein